MNFIIPNAPKLTVSNNLVSDSDSKTESDDIKQNDIKQNDIKPKAITKYAKLCQNVYKFTETITSETVAKNIYVLYNNACETKKKDYIQALQMFKMCEEIINKGSTVTDTNIIYEIYVNLALLSSDYDDVKKYYTKAINIIDDRAEPYYYWSIYCNQHKLFEVSYTLLKHAINISYEQAKNKYAYVQRTAYDKYLYEDLSIACYELKKYDECKYYLEQLIYDNDFFDRKDNFIETLKTLKTLELTNNIITI